ncbi:MAG: Acyl-CoA dehydrogenase [Alphaproteobacteria bacterium MarineAlpha2_Bin1]|nr:MAG: Acyl-CoA dehydrogenase [Alphaproteobacteria bacterium MarineAlpha2_Bin1]
MSVAEQIDYQGLSKEEEAQIFDTIDKWLEREVRPVVKKYDHADEYPHEIVEQMKEMGLFGAIIDQKYGGLGMSAATYSKVVMRITEVWMALTGIFNSHLIMATLVQRFGTEDQKQRFLPRFATGELRGGLGLTEPNAGTDLQSIRTKATKDGENYIIDGSKTWISNGVEGSCFALLTKTDPNIDPAHKGMSFFIVEKGEGFTVSKRLEKLGYKSIDSAELVFQNFKVPSSNLVGQKEGQGFYQAAGGLEIGRINVAARGVGIASAALKDSTRYAQERHTFGKPIAQHQAIQLKLGDMATKTEAARLLVMQAAEAYDKGERCDMEAGMAKYYASEIAVECSLDAMRIHGGYGYSKEFDIERYFRDAPLMCIGEGTNEIQRIIIAKQLVARNPI